MGMLADKLREKNTLPEYREGLKRVRGLEHIVGPEYQGFPPNQPGHETVLVYMDFEGDTDPRAYIDQVVDYLRNTGGIDPATADHEATYFNIDAVGGYFAMQIRKEDAGKCEQLILQNASYNRGIDPHAPGLNL